MNVSIIFSHMFETLALAKAETNPVRQREFYLMAADQMRLIRGATIEVKVWNS